jgi:hypothetical protein
MKLWSMLAGLLLTFSAALAADPVNPKPAASVAQKPVAKPAMPKVVIPHAVAVVSFNPEPAATVAPLATPSPLAPG